MKPVTQTKKPSGPKQRLRSQAKTIAREFQAFEIWNNDNQTEEQRYQLRLLPTPIHEYDDPEKGIFSGSIFVLSYGSNPELVMVLEALKDGWRCGFGRLGHAKATVQHDDKEFYSHEWYGGRDPFYLFHPVPKPSIEVNAESAK